MWLRTRPFHGVGQSQALGPEGLVSSIPCWLQVFVLSYLAFCLDILSRSVFLYGLPGPTKIMQDQLNFGCQLSLLNHKTQDYEDS